MAMWATLKTTWYERFYDFYALYLASSGGRTLVNDGKIVFENPAAVSALDVLRRGFAEGVLPRSNFALGRDPFMDGTVAMKIIGPWFIKELDELKVRGLHYDVTAVPSADGTPAGDSFAFADLRSIAIFSTTRHPDAAARFVAYLTSPAADRLLIEKRVSSHTVAASHPIRDSRCHWRGGRRCRRTQPTSSAHAISISTPMW